MDVPAATVGPPLDGASMTRIWLLAFILAVHAASQALMLHGASTVSEAVAAAAAS